MHFLEKFYFKTLMLDLINKFKYNSTKKLPKFKIIILNFGSKTVNIKQLFSGLLALELLTLQKGSLTTTKKSNILLKIRKGNAVGCKLTLRNSNLFYFLENNIIKIFSKLKDFNGFSFNRKITRNVFSYKILDTFSFSELELNYYFFNNLSKLDVTLITTATNKTEFLFFLKTFKFPFKN